MPPARRVSLAVAGSVLALTAAAGCASSAPAERTAGPTPVATPSVTGTTDRLHLPIESYMLTPEQSVQYDWIGRTAIRSCLGRFGFTYPAPAKLTTDSAATVAYSVLYRRYGVTDPDSVHRWGYHPPRQTTTATQQSAPMRLSDLPAAARAILTGYDAATHGPATSYKGKPIPKRGCLNEPNRILTGAAGGLQGPASGADGLVTKIKADSFTDSMADPRVTAVFRSWSTCMKSRGYHLANPMLAAANLPSMNTRTPTGTEIAQAEADVACKTRTNLTGIWFAVESDYQNAAIAKHSKELAGVKKERDAEVADIQRLLRTMHA
ncbi:hypothetical protein [Streptomyces sp. NPDC002676]